MSDKGGTVGQPKFFYFYFLIWWGSLNLNVHWAWFWSKLIKASFRDPPAENPNGPEALPSSKRDVPKFYSTKRLILTGVSGIFSTFFLLSFFVDRTFSAHFTTMHNGIAKICEKRCFHTNKYANKCMCKKIWYTHINPWECQAVYVNV